MNILKSYSQHRWCKKIEFFSEKEIMPNYNKERLYLGHMTMELAGKCIQRGKMQDALLVCRDRELHELKDHLLRGCSYQ